VPENVPRHPVPVILLARLAVDLGARGQGIGRVLLVDALRRSLAIAEQLGVFAVVVDAIDDQARDFYLKFDFRELTDDRMHLYLPIKFIRKLNI
jgi:predicted N-acetyltransferase YhbS